MADLRTYSVLIRWNDSYLDMGDYGEIVRARDGTHATRIVRARMARQRWSEREEGETKAESLELYRDAFGNLFGAVTECHEGAIWKSAEVERALRHLIEAVRDQERLHGAPCADPVRRRTAEAEAVIHDLDRL